MQQKDSHTFKKDKQLFVKKLTFMVSIKDFFMQEAYIVAGFRTAVTKSKKGGFRFMRSDELAIELIQGLMHCHQ